MRKVQAIVMMALTIALLPASASAAEKTYHLGISDQRTNVTFESSTDFEQILGTSNKMSGRILADLEAGKGSVEVSVPVASMKTGIEMRDEHMRSPGWLDAEKFAEISFKSDSVKKNDDGGWVAPGTFTMHGISREISVLVEVKEIPEALAEKAGLGSGEWLKISTSFEVKLSDFGVEIPGRAAAKVNDSWRVTLQAFAGTNK
jgi:polyisoprenoid-binding protein YceI